MSKKRAHFESIESGPNKNVSHVKVPFHGSLSTTRGSLHFPNFSSFPHYSKAIRDVPTTNEGLRSRQFKSPLILNNNIMASTFIGYTVLVTLVSPPNAQLQGIVADVIDKRLILRDGEIRKGID